MLIKKRTIREIKGLSTLHTMPVSETNKTIQIEIQNAKQEAKAIRGEAERMLIEAQRKLKEAELKVSQLIQNANLEARRIKEEVYKKTFEVASNEVESLKEQGRELLNELFQVKREALVQAHNEIIKVALDLAEKIIKQHAAVDMDLIRTQVVEAIKKATTEADHIQVFVNPDDLQALEESMPEIKKLFPSSLNIVPFAHEAVDPGSCIIETKSGQLDATFTTQLKTLAGLVSHIEISEPQIDLIPEEPSGKEEENLSKEKAYQKQDIYQEERLQPEVVKVKEVPKEEEEEELLLDNELLVQTDQEEELKEELLGNEPLIQILEEEKPQPVIVEEISEEELLLDDELLVQTDQEEELKEEDEIFEVPENLAKEILEETSEKSLLQGKKKLVTSDVEKIIEEEERELDEIELDYEINDEEENEEMEEVNIKSVLRPKKEKETISSSGISEIVEEVERSPEWKDLVQEEDEQE